MCTPTCTARGSNYYLDTSANKFCFKCFPGCATCVNYSPCTSNCASGYVVSSTTGLCECPSTSYIVNGYCSPVCPVETFPMTGQACGACGFKCKWCTDGSTCLECYETNYYEVVSGACKCKSTFIELGDGSCTTDPTRAACYGKPLTFITDGTCTDNCGAGFYNNGANFCV